MSAVKGLAAAALAFALLTAGCSGGTNADGSTVSASASPSAAPAGQETFNVSGSITIRGVDGIDAYDDFAGAPCDGTEGYSDISTGAQVVVKNAGGTKIGLGELGRGRTDGDLDEDFDAGCTFALLVFGVPVEGDIYSLQIGNRDDYSFTRSEAEAGLKLSLG